MALELSRAQKSSHKTTAQIPVGSPDGDRVELEPVDIWFRPITANLLDEMESSRIGSEITLVEAKALWLSKSLLRWSITDKGKEIKPSLEVLKTLNKLQLDALIDAINDYTYPKKTT